jgi:glycosyltransferase involved in cell wall biosynthesis
MKIAIVNSNFAKISKSSKIGTAIFDFMLITNLAKIAKLHNLEITSFASGNSVLPTPIISTSFQSSTDDKNIGMPHHKIFELALISKAFSMQKKFDLFHISIGNGEIVLPFAQFVRKPILITMHGNLDECYANKFFNLYKNNKNIHFVSISHSQRKPIPSLNFIKTIHHGIDIKKSFLFHPTGDNYILWTGRAIPDKGLDVFLSVIQKVRRKAKIFPIIKEEYLDWLQREVIRKRNLINQIIKIHTDFDVRRSELITQYQSSKLFLFPLEWEEPFGLTLIESMACGTPVVAYARGSIPEIVKDGETGFIVNSSDTDIRGNWIIKKTGIEGLCEAVERIYAIPEDQYKQMRASCRAHVEKNFTVEKMVDQYEQVYKEVIEKWKK